MNFFWELSDEDELIVFNNERKRSHMFKIINDDPQEWIGKFVLDGSNAPHYLKAQPDDFQPSQISDGQQKMPYQKIGRHSFNRVEFLTTDYKQAPDKLEVGNFVSIGPMVRMIVRNHNIKQVSNFNFMSSQFMTFKNYGQDPYLDHVYNDKTFIGSDAWIGAYVLIVGGVTIGEGAVIGAYSVVTKDIPPFAIAVGNPARVINYRFTPEQIEAFLRIKWWDWSDDKINENLELLNDENRVDEFIEKFSK